MPTYYRNKIYSDEEREKLWLEKLDKNVRWINGKKIDMSKGLEYYYKVLEHERKKNKRLGYGDDKKNWERKQYEEDRRRMLNVKKVIEVTEVKEKELIKPVTAKEAFG